MRQLPLAISLADHAVFANYFAGDNAEALAALRRVAGGGGRGVTWLCGPSGTGRSHLLQACVAAVDEAGRRAAYVPLHRDVGLPPEALEGLSALDVVALDDLDAVAGDPHFEAAVLRLYEEMGRRGDGLVVASADVPAATGIALPDLRSRLAAGGVYRLRALDDAGRLEALRLRAGFRGFDLPDETGRYLLGRVDRSTASLFQLLDRLDRESLAARKRLTIPFVREVLGG